MHCGAKLGSESAGLVSEASARSAPVAVSLKLGQKVCGAAAALALVLFFLPWITVSCGVSRSFSGYELATFSMPSYETTSEGSGAQILLLIVPVAAVLIVIGAITAITARSRRRWLSSTWEVLLSLVGGLTAVVALWQVESSRRSPDSMGLGMLMIKIEPAFYLTIVAFAVALIGAVLDLGDTS